MAPSTLAKPRYVIEPLRSWPDRTMRPPVGEQMSRQPRLPSLTNRGKLVRTCVQRERTTQSHHHHIEQATPARPHDANLSPTGVFQPLSHTASLDTSPLLHRCRYVPAHRGPRVILARRSVLGSRARSGSHVRVRSSGDAVDDVHASACCTFPDFSDLRVLPGSRDRFDTSPTPPAFDGNCRVRVRRLCGRRAGLGAEGCPE
jgi:hypothetical protein